MKYSIIIASTRDDELTICLQSLQNLNFSKKDFEVIILTDGPWQSKSSNLAIKVFLSPARTHPSHKRNLGVKKSQGRILCFLDDDTQVERNWLNKISKIIDKNPNIIISGPNRDKRKNFKYKIPNAIQENFLTEGLHSHLSLTGNYILSDYHNMPLCHLIVPRKIYDQINGFNEVANYFMDDVEFCYIASKIGYELRLYPDLEIQHNVRPLFFPYFKYKFRTRYKVGENFLFFSECYYKSKQIWLIGFSYLVLLALPWLITVNLFWKIISIILTFYILVILFSVLRHIKKPWEYIIIVLSIILVHFLSWLAFSIGLIKGLLGLIFNYEKNKKILIHKRSRYAVFLTKNN